MSSGSYYQQSVKCPFYKYDNGKNKIVCEGFTDECLVDARWRMREDYIRHIGVFCSEHYEKCEIYRMVYEAKYDDE